MAQGTARGSGGFRSMCRATSGRALGLGLGVEAWQKDGRGMHAEGISVLHVWISVYGIRGCGSVVRAFHNSDIQCSSADLGKAFVCCVSLFVQSKDRSRM